MKYDLTSVVEILDSAITRLNALINSSKDSPDKDLLTAFCICNPDMMEVIIPSKFASIEDVVDNFLLGSPGYEDITDTHPCFFCDYANNLICEKTGKHMHDTKEKCEHFI